MEQRNRKKARGATLEPDYQSDASEFVIEDRAEMIKLITVPFFRNQRVFEGCTKKKSLEIT